MPTVYKVLGQSAPSATTDTTVYTVPTSTEAVISTINVSNFGGVQDSVRIAIRPDGESLANKHYIAYNVPLAAGAVLTIQGGYTINASDVITVYSTTGNSAFGIFGTEIS